MAEAAEAGMGVLTGAISTVAAHAGGARQTAEPGGARETAERAIRLWQRLGLPLSTVAEQTVVTPACGLAGASPALGQGDAGPMPGGGRHAAGADRGDRGEPA